MNIKLVKLKSGEFFIASVSVKGDALIVQKPQSLVNTHEGPSFQPWPTLVSEQANESIALDMDDVLVVVDADDLLKNEYNKHFGSGLDLPVKKDLVLPK